MGTPTGQGRGLRGVVKPIVSPPLPELLQVVVWFAVAYALMFLAGLLGSLMQGDGEWFYWLRETAEHFGVVGLALVAHDQSVKLIRVRETAEAVEAQALRALESISGDVSELRGGGLGRDGQGPAVGP